ncbi:dual specificity protein phosphatase family protein [Pseudooceanicola sp. MF1-13]|uniref:dual specificity protein phosphatase family protein n=1 Tax=Pseudooceanicola sp. MF1-13 TaxID=3379095 RepID=UPI0038924B19
MGLIANIKTSLKAWERNLRASFNVAPDTPAARKRAQFYIDFFDHGYLRKVWRNFHLVAPGVYRSNHPDRKHLTRIQALGIKTVINLRGSDPNATYLIEREDCDHLGLTLIDCNLVARSATPKQHILDLIDAMRHAEKPFVLHCKSGADRSGFAAAIYLMEFQGETVAQARRMLAPRYLHFKGTMTGILDHILDTYAARQAQGEISFEDWVRTEYDHQTMQSSFNQARGIA